MTEEIIFEAYLSISQNKFEIYLLDKKNLNNIYKEEVKIKNDTNQIDYNLLSYFLDKNIFKIEKLIGKFLKNIVVIIENINILNFSIGMKKKNYDALINKKSLESALTELKSIFKENYQNNKIMHIVINRYLIDGVNISSFDEQINGNDVYIEVNFISVPQFLIREINNILGKYQIKTDQYLDKNYILSVFKENSLSLSVAAFKIKNGQNENEVTLIPKSIEKKGFFEKFFQLFS
tara:strand:+ start:320 stop:1024 length:705 start_codon:yes stop_codon:yes gene_type:complete